MDLVRQPMRTELTTSPGSCPKRQQSVLESLGTLSITQPFPAFLNFTYGDLRPELFLHRFDNSTACIENTVDAAVLASSTSNLGRAARNKAHVAPLADTFFRDIRAKCFSPLKTSRAAVALVVRAFADELAVTGRARAWSRSPVLSQARVVTREKRSPSNVLTVPGIQQFAATATAKPMLSVHHGALLRGVRPPAVRAARGS